MDAIIMRIQRDGRLEDWLEVIRTSFRTVADDFGITPENTPTNPAFLEIDRFRDHLSGDVALFGLVAEGVSAGCVAVEAAPTGEGLYFIERLAVLPEFRHRGFGRRLMDRAFDYVRERGGTAVSIAVIDEHRLLKDWYRHYGFVETGRKEFAHLPFDVCFLRRDA